MSTYAVLQGNWVSKIIASDIVQTSFNTLRSNTADDKVIIEYNSALSWLTNGTFTTYTQNQVINMMGTTAEWGNE